MANSLEIYNWYKRYKVLAADMTELQDQLVDLPSGMMEGIFAGSILSGLEAATTGGMSLEINTGLAVGPTGYFHAVNAVTTVNLEEPASNPARNLIVARPSLVDSDYITNPTNPFATVPLRTTLGSEVVLIEGTEGTSPTYPSTEANDVVICGVRTYPGQTEIAVADIDLTVRDSVAKNASGLQNAAQFDDRLRPYRLTNQIMGVRPSQLAGSNQKQFKASANNRGAIFPKTPGGDFNANDTFLNFQTGAITGGDGSSAAFTPSIPTSGNCIVATVVLTPNNTLSVSYGTLGTRAQCFAGIANQEASGAGSVSIPTTGQPIAFVLVSSIDGATVTEIDFFDARGILQGGGGAGGDPTFINYFVDPDFEATPVGTLPEDFSLYNDGATAVPVDGTGGTVTGVTFLASDTSPIRGAISGVLSKDASNRQGTGLAFTFDIPDVDQQTLTLVRFELETSANYVAGDIVVYVYDVTNGALITPSTTSFPAASGNGGKFQYTFLLGTGSQYRLLWHIATTNATAYEVRFDTMVCSTTPQVVVGSGTREPVPVTFTGTWIANTTYTAFETLLGAGLARYDIKIALTGAPTSAGLTLTLPANRTMNTAAMANFAGQLASILPNSSVGIFDAAPASYVGAASYGTDKTVNILWSDDSAVGTQLFAVTQTAPFTFANGDFITVSFVVPIAELAGEGPNFGPGAQVQAFSSSTGTWDAAAAAGNTVGGGSAITGALSAGRAKVVRLPYAPQNIDMLKLQFRPSGYTAWIPQESWAPYVGTAAVDFGAKITAVSGHDVTVFFYQFKTQGSTFNSTTGASSWSAGDGEWRIIDANPSSPVGFGLAGTDGSAGLVAPYSAAGIIASGRWTPTLTPIANVAASTTSSCIYSRVGKIVTCSGFINIDPTTAGNTATQLRFSLPFNTTPTAFGDVAGTLVGGAASGTANMAGYFGWVSGSNADVFFNCTDAANNNYSFSFQYEIK